MRRVFCGNVCTRLLTAFVIVAFVPLLVFGALVYVRTSKSLREVERREITAQATGAQQVLRQRISAQRSFVLDYTVWDELYTALQTDNPGWIRTNIVDWVPANSTTNLIRLYDAQGLTKAVAGETPAVSLWKTAEVRSARNGEVACGLENIGGRLYILAAGPVIAQTHRSKPAGILVLGEQVDDAVLCDVNRFTGGSGHLTVYTDRAVTATTDPADDGASATPQPTSYAAEQVFREGDYTSQIVPLDDAAGRTVSLLKVSVERDSFATALGQINSITVLAFVVALCLAGVIGLFVAQTISRPLRRLATAASGMAEGDLRQELPTQRHDEIGSLAKAFNMMSARIADEIEELSTKTQTLALEISNLSAFGATLTKTPDPHAELRRLADMIRAMFDAETVSVFLVYEGHTTRAAFSGGDHSPVPSPAADELAAWVVQHARGVQIDDVGDDGRLSDLARSTSTAHSYLVVPLTRQEGVVGAISVGFLEGHEFGPEELPLLTTIAGQIAFALQNSEAYEKLDRMYLETVTALAAAMEAKDQYTAAHADSLCEAAVAIGGQLGLSDSELRMVQYAAVLHDIGKIGIPGSILNKPDKLTAEEFETMAQHTIIGERIISRIDYLVPISRIIRSAHERWDGRGYPDGLSGEDIPLAARILLVCDAFDAMTTDRPYRKALSVDTALSELSRNAGTQFDPRVVEIFLDGYPFDEEDDDELLNHRLSYASFVELS